MVKQESVTLKAFNTTFCSDSIKDVIIRQYDFLSPETKVEFLQAGVNDTYIVLDNSQKYVFRIYRAHLQSQENIQFEIDFLNHLHNADVAVSTAIKNYCGDDFMAINSSEGERFGALFTFAPGDTINYKDDDGSLAEKYGHGLAKIHTAQTTFASDLKRKPLDLQQLVNIPLQRIERFFAEHEACKNKIKDIADYIVEQFSQLPPESLTSGICHGDTHSGNAHIDDNQLMTFFDFDCCGLGWLEYDLACYHWGRLVINDTESWPHFLKGYVSVNKNYSVRMDVILLLVAMRQLWVLGLHADNALLFGKNWYNRAYFEMKTEFFTHWKSLYLKEI